MAPLGAILVLTILGGGAALAASSNKKRAVRGPGGAQSYELDSDLPASTEAQVLGALGHESDPHALEQLATQMDARGYHLSADALRARAKQIAEDGTATPAPTDGSALDAGIDPATRGAVLLAVASETDPEKLTAFAESLRTRFPIAASLLYAKAATMRAAQGLPPAPMPSSSSTHLDAGIDQQTEAAILQALASEMDAASLQAFAASIQSKWPIAAALLLARAESLHHHGALPHAPSPHAPPAPPPPHPHAPPAPAPQPSPQPPPRQRPPAPNVPASPAPQGPPPRQAPAPAPQGAVCPFALPPGATCIDEAAATAAAHGGFTTPKSWPPPMTQAAQSCFRSSSARPGRYYVWYSPDGGLYELTKTANNCTLRSTHDVDASLLEHGAPGPAPAPRQGPPPRQAPPGRAPAPGPHAEPASPSAGAPFPVQAGLVYVPPSTASVAATEAFSVPKSWPPSLTAQAVAVNKSSAPAGSYYVLSPGEGALYQLTKGGGNTVLKRAHANLDALSGAGIRTSGGGGGGGSGPWGGSPATIRLQPAAMI